MIEQGIGVITIGSLLASAGGWLITLLSQGEVLQTSDPVSTLVPASALTAVSAALVWVVKKVANGELVHRDPAEDQVRLEATLKETHEALEQALIREDKYRQLAFRDHDD